MTESPAPQPEIQIRIPVKMPAPEYTYPPIAGFWQRLFAFLIDLLILGIFAEGLGALLSSFLFQIGPYGQLLGLLFILPYFGIMNSKVCKGQTLGNKLLRIAIRNPGNQPISIGQSFARISLLIVPIHLLLCFQVLIKNIYIISFIAAVIYAWEITLVVLTILNKQAHQGSHDLLLKTYVVDMRKKNALSFPATNKSNVFIAALCLGMIIVGYCGISIYSLSQAKQGNLKGVYGYLDSDPRFFTASASDSYYLESAGKTEKTLIVDVWYKGKVNPFLAQAIYRDLASTTLSSVANINDFSYLNVKISSRYYLGLYSFNRSNNYSGTIDQWRQKLSE
jgi:uncharacterized RDD family membrane protein YckC